MDYWQGLVEFQENPSKNSIKPLSNQVCSPKPTSEPSTRAPTKPSSLNCSSISGHLEEGFKGIRV